MNEWKTLLEQSHPNFKDVMTVDEALNQEATQPKETSSLNEIEWISPTHKLQSKLENIPDKFGFKIGEAADYVGVKQYVLRYWESEFEQLKPKKSKNGQRMYTKKDVQMALMIRKLLHDDRFSIEGAQAALKKLRQQVKEKPTTKSSGGSVQKTSSTKSPTGGLDFAQALLENIRQARLNLNL